MFFFFSHFHQLGNWYWGQLGSQSLMADWWHSWDSYLVYLFIFIQELTLTLHSATVSLFILDLPVTIDISILPENK